MRRIWAAAVVLAGSVGLGGVARGQALDGGPYAGPSFGAFPQPTGLYTSVSVPGMGRGGPGVMLYFPSNGGPSFTPSPMGYSVAGLQVPVVGTTGSVYLPGSTIGAPTPLAGVAGGGLGLPTPARPAQPAAAPARPLAATKKAKAAPKDEAPKAEPADEPKSEPAPARSTLRERRGIR